MFQCQHRLTWRTQFQQKLTNQLQKIKTPQALQTKIEQWFINILTNPQHHQQFHQFNAFAGLPPLQWRQEHRNTHTHHNTNRWILILNNWLVLQGFDLWMQRNKALHDNTEQPNITHQILNEKIKHLYTLQHDVGSHDREIFQTPIEEKFKLTLQQQKIWIDTTATTIHQCIYEQNQKMSTGQLDIRTFFTKQGKIT